MPRSAIPPGELAIRIETALWDSSHDDDGEAAVEAIKDFMFDNAESIIYYLRYAAMSIR